MTSAGLADVATIDAGAASGLINTFHQLGSALGLAVHAAAHRQTGPRPNGNPSTPADDSARPAAATKRPRERWHRHRADRQAPGPV